MMLDTLYKTDSVGRIRTWSMEIDGSRYRTLSGLQGGKQAVSGWTQAKAASKDTDAEQALFEVNAQYKHQLDREYRRSLEELSSVSATFTEPMLAKTYDPAKITFPVYGQAKLDGIRCIARADGLFSRQGQRITAVPHIEEALAPVFAEDPNYIFDGELYNHDFREDFGAISSIVRKQNPSAEDLAKAKELMQYHVYDLISAAANPYSSRRVAITNTLKPIANERSPIRIVPSQLCGTQEELDLYYEKLLAKEFEGQMVRLDAKYELGRRSKHLLKRKEFITEEFPLLALEEGNGNWAGAAKRATLQAANGASFGAGIRGKLADLKLLLGATVYPGISVATVRYQQLSPDGIPRFPVVVDYHLTGRKD